MKRREFLQLLGVTATVPLMGTDIVIPTPSKPIAPPEVVKVKPATKVKKGQIYFKDIGKYPISDALSINESRSMHEYQCLSSGGKVSVPIQRDVNMDVRLYVNTKEINKFRQHFEKHEAVKEVIVAMDGVLVSMNDVHIESISIISDINEPLALDVTMLIDTNKVEIKA